MTPNQFINMIVLLALHPDDSLIKQMKESAAYIGTSPDGVLFPRAVIVELALEEEKITNTSGRKIARQFTKNWLSQFCKIRKSTWTEAQIKQWNASFRRKI